MIGVVVNRLVGMGLYNLTLDLDIIDLKADYFYEKMHIFCLQVTLIMIFIVLHTLKDYPKIPKALISE